MEQLGNASAEQLGALMALLAEQKKEKVEAEKKTQENARETRKAEIKTELLKPAKNGGKTREQMAELLAGFMEEKEHKKIVNKKKENKTVKAESSAPKCRARKCYKNEELYNEEKYGKIRGGRFNAFKPCGGKCVAGKSFCAKHSAEAEGMKYGNTKDGNHGEPFSFPYHTLPHQREWVKMVYELHPEIKPAEEEKPAEEKEEEKPAEEVEGSAEELEEEEESEEEENEEE